MDQQAFEAGHEWTATPERHAGSSGVQIPPSNAITRQSRFLVQLITSLAAAKVLFRGSVPG